MAKLSKMAQNQSPRPGTLLRTLQNAPDTRTAQGGAGFTKDAQTELFTLAVSNFVGEKTFYESGQDRDRRFNVLVNQVTKTDPEWVARLLTWLRTSGNMRSASIVGAIEYGRALSSGADVKAEITPRRVLDSVLQRADEPAEALGYWLGNYGRPVPKWLKRALADAAERLYKPYSVFKYDTNSAPIRFGDVLAMAQPDSEHPLGKWLLDRTHKREEGDYGIEMLRARRELDAVPVHQRARYVETDKGQEMLRAAGITWESLSGWVQGPMTAEVWEAAIPQMGYMALLRNLRNFDEAGVSDRVAQRVIEKLTDPEQVARSRQLPFRFLSAYLNVPSDRWKHPLGIALDLSLSNIPQMPGKTLVLIDVSGSMGNTMSGRSSVQYWKQAALFGLAFARGQADGADIFGFDSSVHPFKLRKGENTLAALKRFEGLVHGGATYTQRAVAQTYKRGEHKRILVLTDQQAGYDWGVRYGYGRYGLGQHGPVAGGVFDSVPEKVPTYTYDISGLTAAHDVAGTPTRRLFAGLTDDAFKMMQVLEARYGRGLWPWEIES